MIGLNFLVIIFLHTNPLINEEKVCRDIVTNLLEFRKPLYAEEGFEILLPAKKEGNLIIIRDVKILDVSFFFRKTPIARCIRSPTI